LSALGFFLLILWIFPFGICLDQCVRCSLPVFCPCSGCSGVLGAVTGGHARRIPAASFPLRASTRFQCLRSFIVRSARDQTLAEDSLLLLSASVLRVRWESLYNQHSIIHYVAAGAARVYSFICSVFARMICCVLVSHAKNMKILL
jgi:hypothetical protein